MTDINPQNMSKLTEFAQFMKQANGILITAGAGMGIDSGLPDFRGDNGFWNAYPPLRHLNKKFVEMATPQLFETDPKLAWGFYGLRLNTYRQTTPHTGFTLLKNWADKLPKGAFIFTSNVDGQFQKAGFSEERMMECHGSIHHLQCSQNCHRQIWSANDFNPVVDEEKCQLVSEFPTCPECGAIARPNILMFNDWRWQDEKSDAQHTNMRDWFIGLTGLAIIELGAGTSIPSVRNFGEGMVQYQNKTPTKLLRINPTEFQVPEGEDYYGVNMGALAGLKALDELLKSYVINT